MRQGSARTSPVNIAKPKCTLNKSTALLYINCSCNGRLYRASNFADVDRERLGKIIFDVRL